METTTPTILDAHKVGAVLRFDYFQPDEPSDVAEHERLRTGQTVTITAVEVNDGGGICRKCRSAEGLPLTYAIRFPDGTRGTAFEDELPAAAVTDGAACIFC